MPELSSWNTPTVSPCPSMLVGLASSKGIVVDVEVRAAWARISFCALSITVSVLRPRKSNLTSPAGSTHFMLNWVAGMLGARIAVERHQLLERPVADDDAGGMGRGMAVQALELQADLQQLRDRRSWSRSSLQPRLALDRLLERDRIGRVHRDELAQPVDLAIGHLQHPADIAAHRARLQLAEGDDLRHLVRAVFRLDIVDHLVAPVLAEIDVEVRHRHPFGIEEALEQQVEAQRVEIGDGEGIGNERAGARAAPRSHRDVAAPWHI